MISKSKIEKNEYTIVRPIQYWLMEDLEVRLCNLKGVTKNGVSTFSTPTILIIKHTSKNRSIDISIPFRKANQLCEIMNEFMTTSNGDDDDDDEN